MKQIISLVMLFLFSISFYGQWTADTGVNTMVASDTTGGDLKALGTSDGKTVVVFWKPVSAPQNYELRVQLIDVDGTLLFGSDGMLVSDQIPMSTSTQVFSFTLDTEDNLYIGVTGTQGNVAMAFKMDIDGNHLWDEDGVILDTGFSVKLLSLSSENTLVSWRSATTGKATVQLLDSNGSFIWSNPVLIEVSSSGTQQADLFELSDGFIIIFHRISFGINSNLYAQKYNFDGEAQWAEAIQISNRGSQITKQYDGTQDGDVVYYGYSVSSGTRFDSYLQRINPDGTLPWGINGSDFDTNETNYEIDTNIAFSEGSEYVWSICTYTDTSQSLRGEYVQKFNKTTGERQFTDNAKQLFALSNEPNVHAGQLQLLNDQPFFTINSGMNNGVSPTTLHAVYLDQNGDFVWGEETMPLATFGANKSRVQFTKPINGQSVVVFVEQKSTDPQPRIYAQNIIEESSICIAPSGIVVENVTNETADVSWTENGEATMWEVIYGAQGFNPDTEGTIIEVDTNPEVTITGLDADTQYDVYVKAVCDEDFESEWVGPETFTTSVVSIGEHTIEGFKLYPNPTKNRITISAYNSIDSVVFYNLLGQEILVLTPKSVQYQIDMTGFEGGMYLIKVISDNKTETHRIIKM